MTLEEEIKHVEEQLMLRYPKQLVSLEYEFERYPSGNTERGWSCYLTEVGHTSKFSTPTIALEAMVAMAKKRL